VGEGGNDQNVHLKKIVRKIKRCVENCRWKNVNLGFLRMKKMKKNCVERDGRRVSGWRWMMANLLKVLMKDCEKMKVDENETNT
jgi:CRISPR/Cas system CSM-associated protein Csm2 small subunit